MARISCFYSYKGGSGRSLGLANCAVELARRGRRVACIELDVEAPGLLSIFGLDPKRKKSVVDLLIKPDIMALRDALVDVKNESLPSLDGKLLLLPARLEDREKVSLIEWQEHGQEVLWKFNTNIVEPLQSGMIGREPMDHILIDSRSGTTDASVLATLLASYAIVYFFRLDRQSRAGTAFISGVLRDMLAARGRKLRQILVAAAVPLTGKASAFLREATKLLERDVDVRLPFDPELQLEEELVVLGRPKDEIAVSYATLVELLDG